MPHIKLKNGELKSWDAPLVMGVINCTPDSYYMSSTDPKSNLDLAIEMVDEGADILDLGAMSSKPGSEITSPEEEWRRLELHLKLIRKEQPEVLISVDTVHSEVAKKSIELGADMINDISFGRMDPHIFEVVREAQVPYIGMHMQGLPSTMQDQPEYEDLIVEIHQHLAERVEQSQIAEDKIILDVGIGFGKTIDQNFELLAGLQEFKNLGKPILVGISRKSLLYKLLDSSPHEMLSATSALHMYVLQMGADILRVHDVEEAKQVIKLHQQIIKSTEL